MIEDIPIIEISILLSFFTVILIFTIYSGILPMSVGNYDTTRSAEIINSNGTKNNIELYESTNWKERYVGLSDKKTLPENHGMIFYMDQNRQNTITMRNMNFDIEVIYINNNNTVTDISQLSKPNNLLEYYLLYEKNRGYGKYVVEVNKNWTDRHNVKVGDKFGFGS